MKSYLKFLSRNKLYTAIEAVGLIVSLAFVILIGSYVWQQYAVTWEHPDRERIYVPGVPGRPGLTFGFPDVITGIPEIEEVSRMGRIWGAYGKNDKVLCAAVDRSLFDLLPCYHFLEGNADALLVKSSIIISESFAREKNLSLGDKIEISWAEYTVGAILKDLQGTVMQDYGVYAAAEVFREDFTPFDNVGSVLCFVKARPGVDRAVLYDKLEAVCKEVYPNQYGQRSFDHLELFRYDELYFGKTGREFKHGDLKTLHILLLVGLLLLLSSLFNYINLSVALAGKRAREMAVRQLNGATRGRIVAKYIGESILFTAVCFAAGLLLADAFCPVLNRLLNDPVIPARIVWSPAYLLAYAGLVVVIGGVSGIVPAVIAGRYNPLEVMKGGYRRRTKMVFSKVFIVLQNALAVFLIACAITMEAQMHKTQTRPMHCNVSDILFLSFFSMEDKTPLVDALESLPCVKRIGACDGMPSVRGEGQYGTTRDGREILYWHYRMDSTAFRMFNFEILEDYGAPLFNSVWFSDESFAASGFDKDHHDISFLSSRAKGCEQVAGVFKAFPTSNDNTGEESYSIISVIRMPPDVVWSGEYVVETVGDRKEAYEMIMKTYDTYAKSHDAILNTAGWIDERIAASWVPARNNMRLVEIFTLLAILISLLGLVAMSTYYADEKAHDIAVRKVFGGTVDSEARRTIRDYMVLVGVACVIGIPVAVYVAQEYLKDFIYRLEGYWWIFVLAVAISVLIAFASVLWQTMKAARTNPAVELKKE